MKSAVVAFCAAIATVSYLEQPVDANSFGINIPICDVYDPILGCAPNRFQNNNRLKCLDTDQQMSWATKAVRTNDYQLFAGRQSNREIEAPQTRYVPGELVRVHVVTTKYGKQYRGILLYAVNEAGNKVGSWQLLNEKPPGFRHGTLCEPGKTIFHAHADHNNYVETFLFRAPVKGTGKITFHALVKQGNANTGAFYWPNLNGDFTLLEGTRPEPETNWIRGGLGQSCTKVCNDNNLQCNPEKLDDIKGAWVGYNIIARKYPCRLPLLGQCKSAVGPTTSTGNLCYYHNYDHCVKMNREGPKATCNARSQDSRIGRRICPCDKPATQAEADRLAELIALEPRDGNSTDMDNSGNTNAPTAAIPLLVAMSTALLTNGFQGSFQTKRSSSKFSQMLIVLVIAVSLLPGCFAHNWVESPSRAFQASTATPCLAKRSSQPHVQVAKNQEFEIEWVAGHGDFGYFTVVHADQAEKLNLLSKNVLEEYVNGAPNGADFAKQARWQKYHRSPRGDNRNTRLDQANFWDRLVTDGDKNFWFPRDPELVSFAKSKNPNANELPFQYKYKAGQIANDKRVSYTNAKYPWIESVHVFEYVSEIPAGAVDFARFKIEGRAGGGRHIVHFYWRGYNDCIDVDVVTNQNLLTSGKVPKVYGVATEVDSNFARVDHCVFPNPLALLTNTGMCIGVVKDLQQCMETCKGNRACNGIAVVPMALPGTVLPELRATSLVPWGTRTQDDRAKCAQDDFMDLTPEEAEQTMVCFPVISRPPSDTEAEIETTTDPTNPNFYGTCFVRNSAPRKFLGIDPSESQAPTKFSYRSPTDNCISCRQKAKFELQSDIVPFWRPTRGTSRSCVNCDLEKSGPIPATVINWTNTLITGSGNAPARTAAQVPWTKVADKKVCDGFNGKFRVASRHTCNANLAQRCVKNLIPMGAKYFTGGLTPDTCRLMAAKDSECSTKVMWGARSTAGTGANLRPSPTCSCYVKRACCKTCVLIDNDKHDVYDVAPIVQTRSGEEIELPGAAQIDNAIVGTLGGLAGAFAGAVAVVGVVARKKPKTVDASSYLVPTGPPRSRFAKQVDDSVI